VRQVIIGKFHEMTGSIDPCPFIFHLVLITPPG
jgi:hypothetical protein